MRKMPCLFERDFSNPRKPVLLETVTPGCEWVLNGFGHAFIKRDGTACAVIGGALFARYDVKRGKAAPPNAVPCDPEPDAVTGHWPHWIPVGDEPQFKWHREAWAAANVRLGDSTYELCGPKVNGNPERFSTHVFVSHTRELVEAPRTFEGLREWLRTLPFEGVVFSDGERFAKIRRDDYGYPWPLRDE